MKTTIGWMALAVAGSLLAGCVDDQTTLKLNKDGSGTLIQEVYFSPQIDAMGAGLGAMASPDGAKPAAAAPAADPLAAHAGDIEKRIAAVGPGAKVVKKEAKTSAKGWKGFVLTYAFADVTQLRLSIGSDGPGEAGGGQEKSTPMKIEFRKTPKPTVGFWQEAKPAKPAAAPAGEAAANPMGDAASMAMMGPMLQGMRMGFKVEVDGRITRTNSANKQGDRTVTLLDIPVDKLIANAQAAKLMGAGGADPESLGKLRALNIPGLLIDDLEKGVAIEFE